jgi:uncharacterized protein (DUF302 family)
METQEKNGIVTLVSRHSVDETVGRLLAVLKEKGVGVFAVVDHSGEAAKVGLKMRGTKLVIFGNPKGGTPVMVAAPSAAIDLPLKILVAEDEGGRVLVSYNSVGYLRERHGIGEEAVKALGIVAALAEKICGD